MHVFKIPSFSTELFSLGRNFFVEICLFIKPLKEEKASHHKRKNALISIILIKLALGLRYCCLHESGCTRIDHDHAYTNYKLTWKCFLRKHRIELFRGWNSTFWRYFSWCERTLKLKDNWNKRWFMKNKDELWSQQKLSHDLKLQLTPFECKITVTSSAPDCLEGNMTNYRLYNQQSYQIDWNVDCVWH